LGQGRPNAKAHLDANPQVAKEIETKIYAALGLNKDAVTPIDRDKDARPPIASEPAPAAAVKAA
ncbi:MAG TPA: DNA recombination/repair protein RecA, partial [Solirubrobacteraceae bacterium]|nr:DNA recombination/repair protein RecA [Solirubrobacteraceae bacterium]